MRGAASDWIPLGFLDLRCWRLRSGRHESEGWSANKIARDFERDRLSGDELVWGPGFIEWLPVMQVFTSAMLDDSGRSQIRELYCAAHPFCPVMLKGRAEFAAKRWDQAEELFLAGYRASIEVSGDGWDAMIELGKVYVKQGRVGDAQEHFEKCLPDREACTELIRLLRQEGQRLRKEKDDAGALVCLNRMLSISYISDSIIRTEVDGASTQAERERGRKWLDEIRASRGTIYAWVYERDGAVAGDGLLGTRDYQSLHRLTFGKE